MLAACGETTAEDQPLQDLSGIMGEQLPTDLSGIVKNKKADLEATQTWDTVEYDGISLVVSSDW